MFQCTRSRYNTPTPTPQLGITRACAPANAAASPVRGSICLASPDLGRFWGGAYIYQIICGTPPLACRPLETSVSMMNGGPFFHSHSGRPPHGPLPPFHPPNGENTKAWDWISDGNSNPNEWSHSWVIRKLIISMENTTLYCGNSEKFHCPWREKKLALNGWKRKTVRTQIRVNEWYWIHIIKFRFLNVKN